MHPLTSDQDAQDVANHREHGFAMAFRPHVKWVDIRPDLVPTLLDLMRQPIGDHLQGRSLQPVLRGDENLRDNDVIIEWNEPDVKEQQWRTIITSDGWKLNLCAHDRCELYDLNSDPRELKNRFEDGSQHGRIAELTQRIRFWQESTGDTLALTH